MNRLIEILNLPRRCAPGSDLFRSPAVTALLCSFVLIIVMTMAGCVGVKSKPSVSFEDRQRLYEAAKEQNELEFEQALFIKPLSGNVVGADAYSLPLFVQPVSTQDTLVQNKPAQDVPVRNGRIGDGLNQGVEIFPAASLGSLVKNELGQLQVDQELPAIYMASDEAVVQGKTYAQTIFLWVYSSAEHRLKHSNITIAPQEARRSNTARAKARGSEYNNEECFNRLQVQGVRISFGVDGFPVVWELLERRQGLRRVFAAESLEQAARQQWGEPLPGRRFAVERSIEDRPDVIVVGLIADGPVPMGPYIYRQVNESPDGYPTPTIATLDCRCSPLRVGRFIKTIYYDVLPLKALMRCNVPLDLPEGDLGVLTRAIELNDAVSTKKSLSTRMKNDRTYAWDLEQTLRWPESN